MSDKSNVDQKIWTLKEALYKFCDQSVVKKLKITLEYPDELTGGYIRKARRAYNWVQDEYQFSPNKPERNCHLTGWYKVKLWSELSEILQHGELHARARKGSVTTEFLMIPASAWKYLKLPSWEQSVVFEGRKPDRINYYEVQIYLPQDAPSIDQPKPTGVSGGGKISAAEFVHDKLTEFATDRVFDGDKLTRHFDQRGHKSEWIKGLPQSGRIVFEASTIRKQLDLLLKDKKYLTAIRN